MGIGLAVIVQIVGFVIGLVAQRGESVPGFLKGFVMFNGGCVPRNLWPRFSNRELHKNPILWALPAMLQR